MIRKQSAGSFVTLENVRDARAALRTRGCLLLEDAYDRRECDEIVHWMDAHVRDERTEINYSGTELRIWDSERRHQRLRDFWEQCNVFTSCMLGVETEAFTLLAIRNLPIDRRDPRVQLGRWHIDSFRRQYKIFLFLVEVDDSNGPFEFITGTHTAAFKARMALNGAYFRPGDLFRKERGYSRLDDGSMERIMATGYESVPAVCPAGTVMIVDTSLIHRARPCFAGARYALTAYYS